MKLRPAGRVLGAFGFAAVAAGRILGVIELSILGLAALGLVIGAIVWTRRQPSVAVRRTVTEPVVAAGRQAQVHLEVVNPTSRSTPALIARDPVGVRAAQVAVPPIEPGGAVDDRYRLDGLRRGRISIGPLELVRTDPFGIVQRSHQVAGVTEIVVMPRIDPIRPIPVAAIERRAPGPPPARAVGTSAGELAGLRRYVRGDDLRRVHWRASRRRGDLIVREDVATQAGVLAVVLDDRAALHTPADFEEAVSAAASVVAAAHHSHGEVEVITTSGGHVPPVMGRRIEAALGLIAEADLHTDLAPDALARALARRRRGATTVVVTGRPDADDVRVMARSGVTVAVVAPDATVAGMVAVAAGDGFVRAWTGLVRRLSTRRGAA